MSYEEILISPERTRLDAQHQSSTLQIILPLAQAALTHQQPAQVHLLYFKVEYLFWIMDY